jgi:hypothetical protein
VDIKVDDLSDHEQFDEVDSSITALDVGYEWLMPTERLCHFGLRQPFRAPLVSQRRCDQSLAFCVN